MRPCFSGDPGWLSAGAPHNRPQCGPPAGRPTRTLEGTVLMAAKPKPETTEDAREEARRALQTSMDTRQ
jgi:hypothetical protein